MKQIWLTYNSLADSYVFYEGFENGPQRNRHELRGDEKEVLLRLGGLVDSERKSVLHLVSLPSTLQSKIKDSLEGSRIEISIEGMD